MRHRKTVAKLSRTSDHRKAMMRNLATSLALHGKLVTTDAKAKALVSYYEKLLTLVKATDKMNAIRRVKRYLYTEAAQKAFMDNLEKLGKRSGNVRMAKVGVRQGDGGKTILVELGLK